MFLTLLLICFISPIYCSPQVVGWGIQNSIGASPFNPPWYDVKNVTDGLFPQDDYFTWPNNTVPYVLDTNVTNFGGNLTLRKIIFKMPFYLFIN